MKEPSSVIEYNSYNTDFKPNDLANQKAISAFWKIISNAYYFAIAIVSQQNYLPHPSFRNG